MVVKIVLARSGIEKLIFADNIIKTIDKDAPPRLKLAFEQLEREKKEREKIKLYNTSLSLLKKVIPPIGPWIDTMMKINRSRKSIQNLRTWIGKMDWNRMRGFYKKWYETYVLKGNRDGETAIFMEEVKGM